MAVTDGLMDPTSTVKEEKIQKERTEETKQKEHKMKEEQTDVSTKQEPVKDVVQTQEEIKQEQAVAAEPPADVKKKRIRKAPTTVGYDFSAVIEYLGSPVESISEDDFDKVMEEIRTIRDLQMNAARRSVNLISELTKGFSDVVKSAKESKSTLDAILNVLK